MAKYYGISPRIIGVDSHGHIGLKEPHLHLFQKSKLKGYINIHQKEFDFAWALSIFYDLLNVVIQKYEDDINEKN